LMVRYLSHFGVYIKDGRAIELGANISHIVFDKTGTLTDPQKNIRVLYENLTEDEKCAVVATVKGSMHPISLALLEKFVMNIAPYSQDFREYVGNGVCATVNGMERQVGRYAWLQEHLQQTAIGDLDLSDSTVVLL